LTRRHDQRTRIRCQLHSAGRARHHRRPDSGSADVTNGSTEQLRGHLGRAQQNGLTETELKEMITHLAFYAGWPRAMSAISLARELLDGGDAQ
jgi:2,4-dienoyl-CoA reductase-like NADH-dependent reductase (Old Yellow Enzyme family)